MKALTIKQPWASLIILGYKRFEFRSWQTKYRGDLLIHAGLGVDKEAMKRLAKYLPKDIPKGEIIGKVKLVDCIKVTTEFRKNLLNENSDIYASSGTFSEEYEWQMENIEKFDNPIKVKGHLSLWDFFPKDYIVITTLCDKEGIAKKLSKTLLEKHLIAGSQVSKVQSQYWWHGKLESKEEYKLEFRTRNDLKNKIVDVIKSIHDYDVAEISSKKIECLTTEMANWIDENLK